jgi:hypothetical protein
MYGANGRLKWVMKKVSSFMKLGVLTAGLFRHDVFAE